MPTEQPEPASPAADFPQVYGIYDAEDLEDDHPLHIDDAFGWVLETADRAYLIRRDPDTGESTFGVFPSVERIVRRFGRVDPIAVLHPREQPVWPDRLSADAFTPIPADATAQPAI